MQIKGKVICNTTKEEEGEEQGICMMAGNSIVGVADIEVDTVAGTVAGTLAVPFGYCLRQKRLFYLIQFLLPS